MLLTLPNPLAISYARYAPQLCPTSCTWLVDRSSPAHCRNRPGRHTRYPSRSRQADLSGNAVVVRTHAPVERQHLVCGSQPSSAIVTTEHRCQLSRAEERILRVDAPMQDDPRCPSPGERLGRAAVHSVQRYVDRRRTGNARTGTGASTCPTVYDTGAAYRRYSPVVPERSPAPVAALYVLLPRPETPR